MKLQIKTLLSIFMILIGIVFYYGYYVFKDYQAIVIYSINHTIANLESYSKTTKDNIDHFINIYPDREKPIAKDELLRIFDNYSQVLNELSNIINMVNLVEKNDTELTAHRYDVIQDLRQKVISDNHSLIILTQEDWRVLDTLSTICTNHIISISEIRNKHSKLAPRSLAELLKSLHEKNQKLVRPL